MQTKENKRDESGKGTTSAARPVCTDCGAPFLDGEMFTHSGPDRRPVHIHDCTPVERVTPPTWTRLSRSLTVAYEGFSCDVWAEGSAAGPSYRYTVRDMAGVYQAHGGGYADESTACDAALRDVAGLCAASTVEVRTADQISRDITAARADEHGAPVRASFHQLAAASTAADLIRLVGQTVEVRAESFRIPCKVRDAKRVYGVVRVLVAPVHGEGEQWIQLDRVTRALPEVNHG